jgi:predicted O-methyltransferase YrrM
MARRAAILALGALGDYTSNTAMGRALQDADRGVRILADNAIRQGRIVEAGVSADIDGIRAMHDLLAADPSLIATTLPVGDGMAIAVNGS